MFNCFTSFDCIAVKGLIGHIVIFISDLPAIDSARSAGPGWNWEEQNCWAGGVTGGQSDSQDKTVAIWDSSQNIITRSYHRDVTYKTYILNINM